MSKSTKTKIKSNKPSLEFLNDVRKLADTVRGFLNNSDGNDDRFILAMDKYVAKVERHQQIED
jgi:hypothetical protein